MVGGRPSRGSRRCWQSRRRCQDPGRGSLRCRSLEPALTELHQISILAGVSDTAGTKQRGETEVRSKT